MHFNLLEEHVQHEVGNKCINFFLYVHFQQNISFKSLLSTICGNIAKKIIL